MNIYVKVILSVIPHHMKVENHKETKYDLKWIEKRTQRTIVDLNWQHFSLHLSSASLIHVSPSSSNISNIFIFDQLSYFVIFFKKCNKFWFLYVMNICRDRGKHRCKWLKERIILSNLKRFLWVLDGKLNVREYIKFHILPKRPLNAWIH